MFIIRPRRLLGCALAAVATYLPLASAFAVQTPDSEYEAVAEEFIKGYFAARPLLGTAIGLHEYDGKITDYSRLALDAELSRLKRFDDTKSSSVKRWRSTSATRLSTPARPT